jgi:hypothetical protein
VSCIPQIKFPEHALLFHGNIIPSIDLLLELSININKRDAMSLVHVTKPLDSGSSECERAGRIAM